MRKALLTKLEAECKLFEEMALRAGLKAEQLRSDGPVEFEYVVEIRTYWGDSEDSVTIRSKGNLAEAISAGIREFHVKNDRGDAINGCAKVAIEALGVKLGGKMAVPKQAIDELFERLNRDKSLWMDLYEERLLCGTITQLIKKK